MKDQSRPIRAMGTETPSTPVQTVHDALSKAEELAQTVQKFMDELLGYRNDLSEDSFGPAEEGIFPQLENHAYRARRSALIAIDRIATARGELAQ